jgi:protein-tyrosine-phosphatase
VLERADEIFVMTRAHRDSIAEFAPDAVERVKPLDRKARDIPDPYGHGPAAYEKVADVIHAALQARLDDL